MKPLQRNILGVIRTVHIYVTMFAMIGFSFFALTGLMLNHKAWFGLDGEQEPARTATVRAMLPLEALAQPDRLAVVEHLRRDCGISAPLGSFEVDESNLYLQFEGPGIRVEATVDRQRGQADVTKMYGSLPVWLADVHKGVGTTPWLRTLSDAVALLLLTATLSGLVLWVVLPKRRLAGIVFLLLGIGLYVAGYLLVVPC